MPFSDFIKILLVIIFITILVGCEKEPLECIPEDLKESLLCYYPFNGENVGIDNSSFGRDLDSLKDVSLSIDRWGNIDCAAFFSGGEHGKSLILREQAEFLDGLESFSVSIWYQPFDPDRYGGKFETLVARNFDGRCPDRSGEWSVGLFDCRKAVFGHNNSAWSHFIDPSFSSCDGVPATGISPWINLVAVKKDSSYTIYKDGLQREEESGNANCNNFIPARDIGPLIIGDMFNGSIDDVMIFDKALSEEEINEILEMEDCGCK